MNLRAQPATGTTHAVIDRFVPPDPQKRVICISPLCPVQHHVLGRSSWRVGCWKGWAAAGRVSRVSVASRAEELAAAVPARQRDTLLSAAWLHDMGYAPTLARTGFHPVDGARFLQDEGWPKLVVELVAHHTGAAYEAEERGVLGTLSGFGVPPQELLDALTAADMTTGPDGTRIDPQDLVGEILTRYEPEHPVHRAVTRSGPELVAAVDRTLFRLT